MRPLSRTKARKILREIIRELPERRNPQDETGISCVYHNGGRGRSVRRCLIGEMGHRAGLPRPTANVSATDLMTRGDWRGLVDPGIIIDLNHIQRVADGHDTPRAWGSPEVRAAVREL